MRKLLHGLIVDLTLADLALAGAALGIAIWAADTGHSAPYGMWSSGLTLLTLGVAGGLIILIRARRALDSPTF